MNYLILEMSNLRIFEMSNFPQHHLKNQVVSSSSTISRPTCLTCPTRPTPPKPPCLVDLLTRWLVDFFQKIAIF